MDGYVADPKRPLKLSGQDIAANGIHEADRDER